MNLEQRHRAFMKFLADVEDQEKLCHMEEGLTGKDLIRINLLGGLKDKNLVEKAITEEYTLHELKQATINQDSSKSNPNTIEAKNTISINRLERAKF